MLLYTHKDFRQRKPFSIQDNNSKHVACATARLLGRKVDDWSSCYPNESSIKNICHIMRQNIEHGHLEPWDAKWGNIWLSKLQQLVPSVAKQRSYDNTVGTLPNMFFPHLEDAKTFAQLVFVHFCIQLHILAGRFENFTTLILAWCLLM